MSQEREFTRRLQRSPARARACCQPRVTHSVRHLATKAKALNKYLCSVVQEEAAQDDANTALEYLLQH